MIVRAKFGIDDIVNEPRVGHQHLRRKRTLEFGECVVVGGEIVFNESLIVLGEYIETDAKHLKILGAFEQNVSIFEIFDYGTLYDLAILGAEVAFGQTKYGL